MADTVVWFHPRCSKCRGLREILERRGIVAEYRDYLEQPPSATEIEQLLALLGESDPAAIMRTKESAWSELGLDEAGRAARVAALSEHPELLERPIVVRGGRAVVARPPERVLPLLD